MAEKNLKINAMRMVLEFATALENSKGLRKIIDEDGNIIVPIDRFYDFCHDIGIILGKTIRSVAEVE